MQLGELEAILDLLTMLFADWRIGALTGLLVLAAISDCRSHRIPNWIVLFGIGFALIDQCVRWLPLEGPLFALAGLFVGLLLFLPLYLLRAMGAGDVKLLAMVGAFLGPADTFRVALATLVVGGAMAIAFVLIKGTTLRMVQNLNALFQVGFLDVLGGHAPSLRVNPSASAGKLPYGVAIAVGTIGYLLFQQLGFI